MADFTDQDLLDEIRFDIKVKDRLKGELVLAALQYVKRETQKKALLEVSRADADYSIPLLAGLFVNSPDIAKSFPQLKETMYSKIFSAPSVLQELLLKEANPAIRSYLIEIAGRINLAEAVPALLDLLGSESEPIILRSAVISLGLLGDSRAAVPIAALLDHADNALVLAATEALGSLGTADAVRALADRLGREPGFDQTVIDILSKLQTPEAIEALNATIASEHAHIRTAAKQKLGAIGVMSVRVLLKNLSCPDPDLVIHSLNVLGDIGDGAAVAAVRNLLHSQPEDANVRFAAYETMGRLPLEKGAFTLAAGLEDPVDNVRAAAAKAIDSHYNALLAGGVRNMTKNGADGAVQIMETVINAQCEHIVMDLLEEDYFKTTVLTYLSEKAHPEVRAYYADIFSRNGLESLAQELAPKQGEKKRSALRVYAVDDSKMILNIYRTVLHNLGCETIAFEFPAQAVERVRQDHPDVVLTDLNMPELTGIDLTVKIRQWFPKETMPVIMVTTQQESKDYDSAQFAGINGIIQKPFTESHIRAALKEFAGFEFENPK